MAKLVHLSVVPHEPTLPAAAAGLRPNVSEATRRILDGIGRMRRGLEDAKPDCIVMVGSDHLCQFFMNNMPPFLVGKAERVVGPPGYEQRDWQLQPYDAQVEGRLARRILTEGFEYEVDFAYSDEFVIDHAFTVPLNFMRPQADLPIVPIFLNFLAPPVPPARRYLKLGGIVRRIIEEWDEDMRVAVIATGHMTNGVGGPYMMRHTQMPESEWDRTINRLILANDVPGIVSHASWEEMYSYGNNTPGFLGYVFAFGVANGAPYSWYDYVASPTQQLLALLEWDEAQLGAKLNGGRS
jgi:protocatechuate 4,5-dioxygenase beta chain